MRTSEINRSTAETNVTLRLALDGCGEHEIDTGIGFLDHMLTLFACHGSFDLKLRCRGDIQVDDHHSTEDIGICLGTAFREALADKRGIARYGNILLPMDEALVLTALDISGRGMLCCEAAFPTEKIGSFDTALVEEFLNAFACNAGITLHVRQLAGRNAHHIAEAIFKGLARALRSAVKIDGDAIPSSKGLL